MESTPRPFPEAHAVRAALKYVSDKDSREVIKELQAAPAVEAEQALARFADPWDGKYPTISQ